MLQFVLGREHAQSLVAVDEVSALEGDLMVDGVDDLLVQLEVEHVVVQLQVLRVHVRQPPRLPRLLQVTRGSVVVVEFAGGAPHFLLPRRQLLPQVSQVRLLVDDGRDAVVVVGVDNCIL